MTFNDWGKVAAGTVSIALSTIFLWKQFSFWVAFAFVACLVFLPFAKNLFFKWKISRSSSPRVEGDKAVRSDTVNVREADVR